MADDFAVLERRERREAAANGPVWGCRGARRSDEDRSRNSLKQRRKAERGCYQGCPCHYLRWAWPHTQVPVPFGRRMLLMACSMAGISGWRASTLLQGESSRVHLSRSLRVRSEYC